MSQLIRSSKRVSSVVTMVLVLSACATKTVYIPQEQPEERDHGPVVPVDVSRVPDARPRPVVRTRAGNKSPYTVLGRTYYLKTHSRGYTERGEASWYGKKFHGRRTANGEVYDMYAMTAAHKTLPIPSYVRVTNLSNQRSVLVRVNDRGPFHGKRIIDLSYAAARKLGFDHLGVAQVEVVDVTPNASKKIVSATKPKPTDAKLTVITPTHQATLNTAINQSAVDPNSLFIQLGAFLQAERAYNLRSQLAWINTPVEVVQDKRWHRVKVGPLSPQAADNLRQDLERQGFGRGSLVYR